MAKAKIEIEPVSGDVLIDLLMVGTSMLEMAQLFVLAYEKKEISELKLLEFLEVNNQIEKGVFEALENEMIDRKIFEVAG